MRTHVRNIYRVPVYVYISVDIYVCVRVYTWVVVKIMVPFWGTLNTRCRIIIGIQKETGILTTTHVHITTS